VNATNHGFDPLAFLEAMPLPAVVQVHLAGGYVADGFLVDGHCAPVAEESWSLLEALVARTPVRGVVLEHDESFPEFLVLLDQVARARRILGQHGGGPMLRQGIRASNSGSPQSCA
jgi:hypothetical protein